MKKILINALIITTIFNLFFIGKEVFATESWYFKKTNSYMLSTEQPGAIEFFNFESKDTCNLKLKTIKNDSGFISFSECLNSSDIGDNEAWTYNIQTSIPQIINNNPVGFQTEQDCNINRDNFLKSIVYIQNKDNNTKIDICTKESNVSNDGVVNVDPLDAKVDLTKVSDTYTPLAPIGDNTEIKANNVGDYINTIIKLAIGLCGALAVIMIILGGIQYMGDESVFGKTEAKSKIFSAILGLLIALGAYALLNTINPDLTGSKGVNITTATIELDPEIYGDQPHSPINGKYCNGQYSVNQAWPDDSTERTAVKTAGINVKNNAICSYVGQQNCTSLYGLDTSKVIAFKQTCGNDCSLIITGGTECWLHSNKTQHLPGNSIVDLGITNLLVNYVENNNASVPSSMNFPVFTKNGIKFMKESNHYHIINW